MQERGAGEARVFEVEFVGRVAIAGDPAAAILGQVVEPDLRRRRGAGVRRRVAGPGRALCLHPIPA